MTVEHVQIIRLSALGDVVLCEPAVAALAARHPTARITVVTRRAYHDLYAAHPRVAAVHTLAEARGRPAPTLAVDLHNRLDTRRLAARARRRLTWRKRRGADLWRGLLGQPLHRGYREGPHQVERIADALELSLRRAPEVHLAPVWLEAAPARPPSVALLPAASRAVKAWPARRFAALGRRLAEQGLRPLVVGGPGEGALLEAVARGAGGDVLPTDTPLGVVAATLSRVKLAVGNDTGLLHLAAAVGTPVVGVFGPTPPGRWGPPPGRGVAVSLDLACAPCGDHGARPCHRSRRVCLEDLPVERVLEATASLLAPMQNLRGDAEN